MLFQSSSLHVSYAQKIARVKMLMKTFGENGEIRE